MEADGVVEMYQRSGQRYNIRYNPFIGDRDSAYFVKDHSVNHVIKSMGTNLRWFIKKSKGKGRLMISRIDAAQSFYSHAICNNRGNIKIKKMSKEIWAILNHYSSTIEKPMHSNYPTGSLSWCTYQRDIANGTNSYKPAKRQITDSIVKTVTQIFKHLANEVFLEGCKNVSNQNDNESFNNVLCSFSPKEQSHSP